MTSDIDNTVEQTTTSDTGATDHASDRHDTDHGRGESVRQTLERSFKEHAADAADRDDGDQKRDDPKPFERPGRSAREAKAASAADAKSRDAQSGDVKSTSVDQAALSAAHGQEQADAPPPAWVQAARKEWEHLPQAVKQAVLKREKDVADGVAYLKQRYEAEDRAWQPHEPVIRQFGLDRAQTIDRMLGWHNSLQNNPGQAWPALIAAQRHDPRAIVMSIVNAFPNAFPGEVQQVAQQAQQRLQQGGQQQGHDPRFAAYANSLEQRLGMIEKNHHAQLQAQTQTVLDKWSRDKEFFQEVRYLMGSLAMPNPETGPVRHSAQRRCGRFRSLV
jgi:hypothetical protein